MKRRIRIAYVLPNMRVGGSESQLLYLMKGLTPEFELTLICTRSEGALIGDVRRLGVYVRVLNSLSGWDFRMQKRISHIFHAHTPHIVHTCLFGLDYFAHRAARENNIPVIISSRRELATWQRKRHRWIQQRGNRFADAIVANSQSVAEYVQRSENIEPKRIHIIPNGINANDFVSSTPISQIKKRFRLPEKSHVIGMVANFSPVKDHNLFMEMANILLQRRHNLQFLLVGTGPLVDRMGRLIIKRKQGEFFTRVSTVNEVAELYALMDVFVLTSKVEGFPNAIMEAMAASRPIVAPQVGGIPELLQDGVTGRLLTSRDPKDFANAVENFLDNPSLAQAYGARAAQWVRERLPMERMVTQYRNLYQNLLSEKTGKQCQ